MSHFTCSFCSTPHELFGSAASFERAANELQLPVLGQSLTFGTDVLTDSIGQLPLVTAVSDGGDAGRPVMIQSGKEGEEVREVLRKVGESVWSWLATRPISPVGLRG